MIPPHRTDSGAFLLARKFGAKSLIYLKDERASTATTPKKDKDREKLDFYSRISVDELAALNLDDLIVERPVLRFLKHSKVIKQFQVIDALRHPEHILAASTANTSAPRLQD